VELAGGKPIEGLDGRSFLPVLLGQKETHRDYAFSIHNNVPEGRPYPIRTIRNTQYKLILNLMPDQEYHEKHMMDIDREGYWHSWAEAAKTDPRSAKMLQRFVSCHGHPFAGDAAKSSFLPLRIDYLSCGYLWVGVIDGGRHPR